MRKCTEDAAEQIAAQAFVIRQQRAEIERLQALVERQMAHLAHSPVPPQWLASDEVFDHLVDRRRAAEGADMPADPEIPVDMLRTGWVACIVSAALVIGVAAWSLWP